MAEDVGAVAEALTGVLEDADCRGNG